MSPVTLSRIQFGMTVGFHFIFPVISIGLAYLLAVIETINWRRRDPTYDLMGRFFAKFLGLTFVMGVATGIVMEFQFGMNWAQYSKYVGDIFGAPLAAEAILAFFLESAFLSIYIFGRDRVPRGVHWFSSIMVAFGATLSAFWILVANSWQQTPAGFKINPETSRAELTSFMEAVFNPSTIVRFMHVVDGALIAGGFFVAGIAAYLLLKNHERLIARKAMKLGLVFAFVCSVLELFPIGHHHAMKVYKYQPEKLAAFEGLYQGGTRAPLTLFGIPTANGLACAIRVPGMLSLLASGSLDAPVKGINDFPPEDRPPVFLPFIGFHGMVGLGMLFILLPIWGFFQLWRNKLWTDTLYLKGLILAIPLPVIACQLGWMTAEVGRQPWAVYKLLRTNDAVSISVSSWEILVSVILFAILYAALGALYVYLIVREAKIGPEPVLVKENNHD